MICNYTTRQLLDWLEGDLAPEQEQHMASHVDSCLECARRVSELRRCRELVQTLPVISPPADHKQLILERIRAVTPARALHCAEVLRLLPAFVENEAIAAADQVIAHTTACNTCQHELRALQMQKELVEAMPPVAPPADMKERIITAVAALGKEGQKERTPVIFPWLPQRGWVWGYAVAAACAVLLAVLWGRELSREPEDHSRDANLIARSPAMQTPQPAIPKPIVRDTQETVPSPQLAAVVPRATDQTPVPMKKDAQVAVPASRAKASAPKPAHNGKSRATTPRTSMPPSPDDAMLAKVDFPKLKLRDDGESEDSLFREEPENLTTIPVTPLDRTVKPAVPARDDEPAPKKPGEETASKQLLVLDVSTANRKPPAEMPVALTTRRHQDYTLVEDQVPSKMLKVNVFTVNFR